MISIKRISRKTEKKNQLEKRKIIGQVGRSEDKQKAKRCGKINTRTRKNNRQVDRSEDKQKGQKSRKDQRENKKEKQANRSIRG
jgi:hypothetical protein